VQPAFESLNSSVTALIRFSSVRYFSALPESGRPDAIPSLFLRVQIQFLELFVRQA
jgi:hypothetical protein